MRLVVLGSGTSFGVPVVGCSCAVCTSKDPRDRRTRVAAVVEAADDKRILIDTPPELRLQLLAAEIKSVDAVLYTHDHADHVHGIDDLRAITVRGGTLPLYGPPHTIQRIRHRFGYIFNPLIVPPKGTSKPELHAIPLEAGAAVTIMGMDVLPLALDHGSETVFGYRIGPGGRGGAARGSRLGRQRVVPLPAPDASLDPGGRGGGGGCGCRAHVPHASHSQVRSCGALGNPP